uniref:Cramped chromatin regulator homolog 1 n=1 Tax=Scleropages formosus TaxID=113540 RepID=A0A8C9S9V4_SCLFO
MVKNKEQVRHFYYRTWHKISKYIDFSNVYSRVLKKSSRELYGLICYAELRKKVGGCKGLTSCFLLCVSRATTVRSKGRNLRIKAPMCRALKKLCDPDGVSDEEDQKPVRLPLKVPVELQPRSNHSWARVQSLAHNPRLRMVVELHRKVSSLIEFLKQKWTAQDHGLQWKSLEEREALEGQQRSSWGMEREELFLYPAENSNLTPLPGVARVVHSKAYCTVHWLESGKCRPGAKDLPAAQILGIQAAPKGPGRQGRMGGGEVRRAEGGTAAEGAGDVSTGGAEDKNYSNTLHNIAPPLHTLLPGQKERSGPVPMDGDPSQMEGQSSSGEGGTFREVGGDSSVTDSDKQAPGLVVKEGPCLEGNASPKKDQSCSLRDTGAVLHCREERTMGGTRSPEQPGVGTEAPPPVPLGDACTKDAQPSEEGHSEPGRSRGGGGGPTGKEEAGGGGQTGRLPQQIREEGWSAHSTENVTLAEVYLMLGKPGKLQLEYEWQPVSRSDQRPQPAPSVHRVLRCLLRLISTEVNPKPVSCRCASLSTAVQEEHTFTPPGKVLTLGVRSPSCGRHQTSIRGTLHPTAPPSSLRNLPRSLVATGPPVDADSGLFAIPTMLPPNSRHGKMLSPNKEAERAFRQQLDSISSDIFLPKQRKPRSRLRKPLVVTLLPRTTGDTPQHVCSFSILSNSSVAGTGSFRPIQPPLASTSRPLIAKAAPLSSSTSTQLSSKDFITYMCCRDPKGVEQPQAYHYTVDHFLQTAWTAGVGGIRLLTDIYPHVANFRVCDIFPLIVFLQVTLQNSPPPPSPATDADSILSPPSVASLLDISLPGPPEEVLSQGEPATQISDSIIELAINSSNYGDGPSLSPAKLNGGDASKNIPSPVSSPHRNWIESPTHDPQWYPNDSSDSSLGSSLISPEKGRKMLLTPTGPSSGTSLLGPSLLDSSSHDSFHTRGLGDVGEVDTQLACMMSENSVDYIARFNDLAQELSVTEPPLPPPNHDGGTVNTSSASDLIAVPL